MNFLIVGDPHLTNKSGIRKDDIIETQLQKWEQIFRIADDNDAKIVVLSDLTDDSDIPYEVVNKFTRLKKESFNNVSLTTAWGNHDEKNDNKELRVNTALANLMESGAVTHTNYIDLNIICNLDYSENIVEYVKDKDIIKPKILCAHVFYDNAFYGGIRHNITKEMAYDLLDQGVEYIFLGHDHKNYPPVTLEKDGKTLTIHRPGATFRKKRAVYEFSRPINVVLVKQEGEKFIINYFPLEVKPFISVISNEKIFEIIKERKDEEDMSFDDSGEGLLDIFKNISSELEVEEKSILEMINAIQNQEIKDAIIKRIP